MFAPLLAMVVLTFAVMIHVFVCRVRSVRTGAVRMSYFRVMKGEAPEQIEATARHFANLFEMPILFYVVAVLILALGSETPLLVALAWGFVAARVVHSVIHLTYNNVRHRLAAFAVANLFLLLMWILVAVKML